MNGRARGVGILCYSHKRADGVPLGGKLRGTMPGFIFNVLIQMVRNNLCVRMLVSVRASCAVFSLTGKVVLINSLAVRNP